MHERRIVSSGDRFTFDDDPSHPNRIHSITVRDKADNRAVVEVEALARHPSAARLALG